jgi:hypothetical protein
MKSIMWLHINSQVSIGFSKNLLMTIIARQRCILLCIPVSYLQSCCCWSCRWGETTSLNCGHQRFYFSSPRWYMSMESHGGIFTDQKPRTRTRACSSDTFSTTNPTWTDPGSNPGLHDKRPATNRLSHGKAFILRTAFLVTARSVRPRQGRTSSVLLTVKKTSAEYSFVERLIEWSEQSKCFLPDSQ